jgi:hypothetical protein
MRCCRFSTCVGYRLATSRKPSPPSWAKRAEPVAGGDLAADGRMAGGLRRLAEARPLARRCVYVWADGVYLQARMEEDAECMLVLIGATPEGKKELVGFQTGVREGAQSWRELLIDIKQRGLEIAPDLAVGDGALGFWKAIEEVFPSTRHQRCWVHKTEPTPCSLIPCDLVELCTTAAQRERYRSCRHCQPSSRS